MSSHVETKLLFVHDLLRHRYNKHMVVMRPPMGRDATIIKLAGDKKELELSNTFLAEASPELLLIRVEGFFGLGTPYDEVGTWDTGVMEKIMEGRKINETPKSANEQWADSWAERLGQQ